MKRPTRVFQTRMVGNVVEAWDGKPGEPESERVCSLDITLIPALIASLMVFNIKKQIRDLSHDRHTE